MECRMKSRVKAMVEELAREHQRELAAAGPLVDLEELTCQIGDEFARQLCEGELMNYPEYRRLGLPLTSSHIESTIKQINRRVKGSEKFWSKSTSEAVLQLRADYLSDSTPLASFWLRHQFRQTGVNAYAQAS